MGTTIWFAVANVSEGHGHVTSRDEANAWTSENPNGWTYQQVQGFGGTIIAETSTEAEAQTALDAWKAKAA